MRAFYRTLRILSAITLFFFCWTFLPLYAAVAYAAAPEGQKSVASSQKSGVQQRTATSADRFEKAIESIRENVGKAGEKADKGKDNAKELETIKAKRAEIESADSDFKKEFAATEKKLKDANLPQEILDRHSKFVKNYEDNLTELKTNLDDVEKLKGDSRKLSAALTKAKANLEKVKAPSKHQKLDPNNLPFKARKAAKNVAPRLKKENFDRDFPKKNSQNKVKIAGGFDFHSAIRNPQSAIYHKPILLAFNETASDVPFQLPRPVAGEGWGEGATPQLAFADSSPFLLAQATGQPSAEDLAETPDVQFTDAIRAKAQELGGKPVNIYNWVRNNIEYAPTYGSIQGADMCLQSKICNDMDTASLLIALLRVSGISAKYVYGTVEIPIEKVMNWVGGVTDPKMAGTVLATNGIPATSLISGGTIKTIQLEHVWVKTFIDYIPSRGAVQRQGNAWIPLDASYKQYNYTHGINVSSAVPFDAQSFANQILSTATTNTTDGSVTNVNSTFVQQTMQDYQTKVQNYIQQNYPTATVGDVIGKKEIIQQNYPILLGTLQYKTVQVGSEFSTVPDNLREIMSFSIPDPTGASAGLTYTTGMPQIAGKKITLSFSSATAADQVVIDSFQAGLEQTSLPAYLINLRPDLAVDGVIVATGAATTMGTDLSWTISLNEPEIGMNNIINTIATGQYFGIGLDSGRIGIKQLSDLKAKLLSTKSNIESGNYANLTEDDLIGDILYTTIISYFAELDGSDEMAARNMNIIRYRAPSIGTFSIVLDIKNLFGMPISVSQKGMMMDVDRIMQAVFSKDGDMNKVKQYMSISGNNSSALEHSAPEQILSTPTAPVNGISAIKALKIANDQGIPIYTINQANVGTIIPQLQVSDNVKTDIMNAVNAQKIVTVSKSNITLNSWSGCGYSIVDPTTGAGAYMIDGGFNGSIIEAFLFSIVDLIAGSMKEGYIKPSNTIGCVGKLAAGATVLSFGLTMYNIVMDPKLSVDQKIINIIAWTITTCIALAATNPILILTPCWGLFAIITVYVFMTALALFLTTDFSDDSSM